MEIRSLPRWLARLFSFLFYGQLVGYVLVSGALLYMLLTDVPFRDVTVKVDGRIMASAPDANGGQHGETVRETYGLKLGMPAFVSNEKVWLLTFELKHGLHDLAKLPLFVRLSFGYTLLMAITWILVCYWFMHLFRSLADQQVFDRRQITRLTRIGQCFLVYPVLTYLCDQLIENDKLRYLKTYGYIIGPANTGVRYIQPLANTILFSEPSTNSILLFMGLCILALAQVFKYGMQLQQENELTI